MPNAMLRTFRTLATDRPTRAAFLTSFSSVCLLTGYEMVRSPSNTLFKAAYGSEGLTWVLAGAPFGLLVLLFIYGRTLTALGPRKTLHATLASSALGILACYLLIQQGFTVGTVLLIVLREAYAVLVIEQYWSFLNSILDEPRAKNVNGPVTGLSSLGGVLGGLLVSKFSHDVGTEGWLVWAALTLIPSMAFAELAYRTGGEPKKESPARKPNELLPSSEARDPLGLHLFRKHPLLFSLFGIILCTQICSTALDIHFQTLLQAALPDANTQTAYSGKIFMWMNALSFGIQFLIAPLLLGSLSLGAVQIGIPILNFVMIAYCWTNPTLVTAAAAFLLFKGMDYSIFRASKEILYIPFSFDVRFRAKEVIDAFGYRFGKGGASLGLFLGRRSGAAIAVFYLPVALAATGLWMFLIAGLLRSRDEASRKHLQ